MTSDGTCACEHVRAHAKAYAAPQAEHEQVHARLSKVVKSCQKLSKVVKGCEGLPRTVVLQRVTGFKNKGKASRVKE